MNVRVALIAGLILLSAIPANAGGEKKGDRAAGRKNGISALWRERERRDGLGARFGRSASITHVDNDEKLLPAIPDSKPDEYTSETDGHQTSRGLAGG